MDFSKLSQNEKLAVYGAAASIIGPVVASGLGFGAGFLTLLLAVAMLAVVFLPQLSPTTTLPGSKGSLMVVIGGIAAVSAALALLSSIGWLGFFGSNLIFVLGWLIGIAGGLLMGWAGWQEFQAEGGKLQLGSASTPAGSRSAGTSTTDARSDTAVDRAPAEPVVRSEAHEPPTARPVDEDRPPA